MFMVTFKREHTHTNNQTHKNKTTTTKTTVTGFKDLKKNREKKKRGR